MLFLETAGLLLLIAFALAPAFKMKFWNIGAEGQISIGCLVTAGIMFHMTKTGDNSNQLLVVSLCLLFSVLAGIIWALIPALFKAFFNTNETLFTLMMNYIAMGFIAAFSLKFKATGSTALGVLNADTHAGWIPEIFGYKYIINIVVIVLIVVGIWFFLKYSKQGYEIAVLNGSVRTAEYVGINVKQVIMRTLIMAGALCGIAGFLIVAGASHTVSDTSAGGRGFTAVMISWLGHFNPLEMALYAFLCAFVTTGSSSAAGNLGYSGEVASVLSGLFFMLILTSEFFVNFKVRFNFKHKNKKNDGDMRELPPPNPPQEPKLKEAEQ
jgi:simple sugar transport system permease protein